MTVSFSGPIRLKGSSDQVTGRQWYGGQDVTIPNTDIVWIYDDFTGAVFNATDTWTPVKDSGASVLVGADVLHGVCALTSAATTDADGASIQGNEVFAAVAGKELWFETRIAPHDANDTDVWVGLTENFVTHPENMGTAANHIMFSLVEGTALWVCRTESGGTPTVTTTAIVPTDAGYNKLGFKVTGTSKVEFYIDGALVATHLTNIPTANMTIGASSVSGSATGTFVTNVDYLLCAAQR